MPSSLAASRPSSAGFASAAGGTSRLGLGGLNGSLGFNNFGPNGNRFGFGGLGFNNFGGNRFGFGGYGGFGFNNFGFGGLGFGLGFGRRWGWGGWGFGWGWGGWDPWFGLGLWGWPAYGYGYDPFWDWNGFYDSPSIDYSAPPDPSAEPPYDQPPPDQLQPDQSPYGQANNELPFYAAPPAGSSSSSTPADSTANPAYPRSSPPSPASNTTDSAAPSELLYLKTGDVYTVTNCWLADGKLHYVLSGGGGEYSVDIGMIDFDRTVNENAKQGVTFTIKPAPGNPASTNTRPGANGSALTPSNSI